MTTLLEYQAASTEQLHRALAIETACVDDELTAEESAESVARVVLLLQVLSTRKAVDAN